MESRWSLGWTSQAPARLPSGPQREPTALCRKGLRWHTLAVWRLWAPVPTGARPAESRLEPREMGEGPDPSLALGPAGLGRRGASPEASFL